MRVRAPCLWVASPQLHSHEKHHPNENIARTLTSGGVRDDALVVREWICVCGKVEFLYSESFFTMGKSYGDKEVGAASLAYEA